MVAWSSLEKFWEITTDHFTGPGTAVGPVCVCPNDIFNQMT